MFAQRSSLNSTPNLTDTCPSALGAPRRLISWTNNFTSCSTFMIQSWIYYTLVKSGLLNNTKQYTNNLLAYVTSVQKGREREFGCAREKGGEEIPLCILCTSHTSKIPFPFPFEYLPHRLRSCRQVKLNPV